MDDTFKKFFRAVANTLGTSVVPANALHEGTGSEVELAVALTRDLARTCSDSSVDVLIYRLHARRASWPNRSRSTLVRGEVHFVGSTVRSRKLGSMSIVGSFGCGDN